MSPSRRLLLQLLSVLAGAAVVLGLLVVLLGGDDAPQVVGADQSVEGPVLLVPGYGGSTGSLQVLAGSLREAGRTAVVVELPDGGTGDLRASVAALEAAADATGAPAVDVVGYSAGGVVARLWADTDGSRLRRAVTLGSPHHGTQVAAIGAALVSGACPVACQQLVPGSDLLDGLNEDDETPPGPQWLSVWTAQDETVTPPTSARIEGALNTELQALCPALQVSHSALPRDPTVTRVVLGALSGPRVEQPTAAVCA